MQSVAFAVAPVAAVLTRVALHPLTMAVLLVTVFPNIHEVVIVNVSLMIVTAYAQAARYGTVIKD